MKFTFRVIWFDPTRNARRHVDVGSNHALAIAKKKFTEGMADISIQLIAEAGEDPSDDT